LRVLGRRADGYHRLESLVAFADLADTLSLQPGGDAALDITGPFASACGPVAGNLVLKAFAALRARAAGLNAGRFVLEKYIPVAAGLGGGSPCGPGPVGSLHHPSPRIQAETADSGGEAVLAPPSRRQLVPCGWHPGWTASSPVRPQTSGSGGGNVQVRSSSSARGR